MHLRVSQKYLYIVYIAFVLFTQFATTSHEIMVLITPFVSLNKCRIQGNKDHCTLQKIIPQNSMNFRNLSSCGTIINPHEIQQRPSVARNE